MSGKNELTESGKGILLYDINRSLHMHIVRIPTSNSHIAVAIHPSSAPSDKLAILCPGYLDSKDYAHMVALANSLSEHDYTAVALIRLVHRAMEVR